MLRSKYLGRWVEVEGWMMYDLEHANMAENTKPGNLKNWRANQKNSGFLLEERAWLSDLYNRVGWVDVYRSLHPATTDECYTWWSNRGAAYKKNVGWRLDYQIATPALAKKAVASTIYKLERFSDHAPFIVDYQ